MNKITPIFVFFLCVAGIGWATAQVVINEIMYNSSGTDVEYVELFNNSGTEINLTGWSLLDDNDSHSPCMLSGTLGSGQYFVVVGNFALFRVQYSGVTNVNPNDFDPNGTGWALSNAGEVVRLFDASGALHDSVAYNDGGAWPGSADGNGPSLELLHPSLDNNLPTSWDPSTVDWGTPGAQNSVYTENVAPTCKDGMRSLGLPSSVDEVAVSVIAYDNEGLASVELFVNAGTGFVAQTMNDNGINGDAVAGDSIFTSEISPHTSGTLVRYYAVATDLVGQKDYWPQNAPSDYRAYTVDHVLPTLRINEVLAVNNSGLRDEFGEYEDWFEIHNLGDVAVNLGGMFVSDDLGASMTFELPSLVIDPGAYLLLWADNDVQQGNRHVDIKFTSQGEAVALFETVDHGNVLIDGWQFGIMNSDISMGIYPEEGTAPEYLAVPTPGSSNVSSKLFSDICINEFLATSAFGGTDDWVEVYNRGENPYDLSGCLLSDERGNNAKWMFPNGTVLDPGEFLVIYEDALGFGFSSEGDDVIMLTAADSTTGLDFYDFGSQQPDKSEGRYPDGSNTWKVFEEPTRGTSNSKTGVADHPSIVPTEFALFQNYPNPFNPSTTISFSLPKADYVTLKIFNVLGGEVATLINSRLDAGIHHYQWQAENIPSGLYYYTIQAGTNKRTKNLVLLR
jgi:hypothetical protein